MRYELRGTRKGRYEVRITNYEVREREVRGTNYEVRERVFLKFYRYSFFTVRLNNSRNDTLRYNSTLSHLTPRTSSNLFQEKKQLRKFRSWLKLFIPTFHLYIRKR